MTMAKACLRVIKKQLSDTERLHIKDTIIHSATLASFMTMATVWLRATRKQSCGGERKLIMDIRMHNSTLAW